jgi:dihydrolipoamide dehydrogenase
MIAVARLFERLFGKRKPSMAQAQHDLVVIGGGPAGYVHAIRAAQLGLNVGVVEKEPLIGGTCLRVGCIPSKALLESSELYAEANHRFAENGIAFTGLKFDLPTMMKRKERVVETLGKGTAELLKKNRITRYAGLGTITAPGKVTVSGDAPTELTAKFITIATGSRVAPLKGVELHSDRVGTSTEALSYAGVPNRLVVIGAGAIGLELGSVWLRLGAKVTVLEYLDRILPETDGEAAALALKIFQKQGMEFRLGSRVTGAKFNGKDCVITLDGAEPVTCDRVLVCVGRIPNTEGLGLANVGIETDARGRIVVDDRFRTKVPGIFAIGDVIPGPMLAHKAEEEGVALAEQLAGKHGHVNYNTIPSVVYTSPEIASVGKSEEQLRKEGIEPVKGVFFNRANGRARILGDTDGFVKILADPRTDRVLGVHIVSKRAGDLIAEAAVAMEFGASSEDIARACHAHPTLPEIIKEAAMSVSKRAIHS